MDPSVREWADALIRWLHVLSGIVWVGHLYFFNFVNTHAMKAYEADTRSKVMTEMMPRALYFFRWAAIYSWVTGILLLGFVYHMGTGMMEREAGPLDKEASINVGFFTVLLIFFVYDQLWKSPLGRNELLATLVSWVLFVLLAFGFSRFLTGRATFIHLGMSLGTIMLLNVWMRIWPGQKKIIKGGQRHRPRARP